VDLDDVGVSRPRQRSRLIAKPLHRFVARRGLEELEGDETVDVQILGQVNDPKGAFAEASNNPELIGAAKGIVMGIEDKSGQRCLRIALRRRDPCHNGLQDIFDPRSFLRRTGKVIVGPATVTTGGAVSRLSGDLLHASAESLDAYIAKQNRYTTLQAQAMHLRGERASIARLVVSPLVRFLRYYVVRLGFLDGVAGFVHIAIGCFASFAKYAKLRALAAAEPQS
jgi:hypothetical protein